MRCFEEWRKYVHAAKKQERKVPFEFQNYTKFGSTWQMFLVEAVE